MKRLATIAAAVLVLAWTGATPAAAHVLLAKAQPNGDGTTTLTFTFDHGCGESPTNGLTITTPAGVTPKSASGPPGWQAHTSASQAVFSGAPIDSGTDAEFHVTVAVTGARVGQSLAFPAIQTCPNGETLTWQDTKADAESPAPTLIVTAAMLPIPTAPSGGAGATLSQALLAAIGLATIAAAFGLVRTRPPPHDREAASAQGWTCRSQTGRATPR